MQSLQDENDFKFTLEERYPELAQKIQDTFLIPEQSKARILDSFCTLEMKSSLEEFFDMFSDIEDEIVEEINSEFPTITRQMLAYIEENSKTEDQSELLNLSNDILLA